MEVKRELRKATAYVDGGELLKPDQVIPRDESGSYLHLKLKRFKSIEDLTMNFAKKTWKETPHDAEIEVSSSGRSSCRQCHKRIEKGELRGRLWLQCHKGCKNSAYFHAESCLWQYPETNKLESVDEFKGFGELSNVHQEQMQGFMTEMKDAMHEPEPSLEPNKRHKSH